MRSSQNSASEQTAQLEVSLGCGVGCMPTIAVTLLVGTMRLDGVSVIPRRRVALSTRRNAGWMSRGRSPYPGEKRQLQYRPRVAASERICASVLFATRSMAAVAAASNIT